ncbi:MAG TPA: type II toxin-antitoxin system HicA family toxin [Hyphomicrobiaceae bacterium]
MAKSSRAILRLLAADGWYEVGQTGSHKHFKHPTKLGKVTVPHPSGICRQRLRGASRGNREWTFHRLRQSAWYTSYAHSPYAVSRGLTTRKTWVCSRAARGSGYTSPCPRCRWGR